MERQALRRFSAPFQAGRYPGGQARTAQRAFAVHVVAILTVEPPGRRTRRLSRRKPR
jgi:hypothetical protein